MSSIKQSSTWRPNLEPWGLKLKKLLYPFWVVSRYKIIINKLISQTFPQRFNFRLRAVSLFSVVRRAKRETRKWPRAWLMVRDGRGTKKPCRPRFARLAASPLPRACIALTTSEEKERLLALYFNFWTISEKVNKIVSLFRIQTWGFRSPCARELTLRSLVGFRAQKTI